MAGVLQYLLSLGTDRFDKPLAGSQAKVERFKATADSSTTPVGNMGLMFNQAGYQVTDFATQVQMGTSAVQAFSQQAPQFIGAIQQFRAAGAGWQGILTANVGILTPLSLLVTELSVGIPMVTAAFRELEQTQRNLAASQKLEAEMAAKLAAVRAYQGDYFAAAHAQERLASLSRLTTAAVDDETDAIRRRNQVMAAAAAADEALADVRDQRKIAQGEAPEDVKIQRAYADEARALQQLNREQEARRAGLFATLSALKQAEAALATAKASPDADAENIAAATKSLEEIRARYAAVQKESKLASELDPFERGKIASNTTAKVEELTIQKAARLAQESKKAADEESRKAEQLKQQDADFTAMLVKAGQMARDRQDAVDAFTQEGEILKAKAAGNEKLVSQLERERKERQLTLQLIREQGLSEQDAAKAAKDRLDLEDRANGIRRRGVLNAADSAEARRARRSAADVARDARLGRDGAAQADRLALDDAARRTRKINPERAAADLAKANGQADPGKVKRDEKAEQARKAADPLYRVVKNIEEKFANIASS